jgi:serine protease AprX
VNFDRAIRKVLAAASAVGVVAGLVVVGGTAASASDSSNGPRQQAIVALSGTSAVSVAGIHVQAVLPAVHSEIVDGDAAALELLARAPGVLGVSPNASAHLEGFAYGGRHDNGHDNARDNGHGWGAGGQGDSHDSHSNPPAKGNPGEAASEGVIAPTTLGQNAGRGDAGHGVTIALIDTGVTDTAALNRASGRLVDAVDTSGLNTDDGTIVEHGVFSDGYGHGTFMASVIAGGNVPGSGNTSLGVAPGATVDVVKVADDQGNTSLAAVLAGLNWVATHSDTVDVANLSLSVDRPSDTYGIDPLNYAVTLTRAAGVTVVVASGNTAGEVGDPGFAPAALTVGAADTTGKNASVASFSGYADVDGVTKPDVVAAGVNVLGEMPANTIIGEQYPDARQASGLFRGSGTSQSTAIVSGLAALYLQGHHGASPYEVKAAIRDSARSITADNHDGQGLVSVPGGGRYSVFDTGEFSLNLAQWYSTAGAWGDVLSSDVFDVRRWANRRWAADDWDNRRWAGDAFDVRRWANRRWASDAWDCRRWASIWGDRV